MSQTLAGRQNQPLRRRIHGHVRGLLNDVKTFEVNGHGMGRIRQPAVRERIGSQKVTEFVVPTGFRNAKKWNQGSARSENQQAHNQYADRSPSRQP